MNQYRSWTCDWHHSDPVWSNGSAQLVTRQWCAQRSVNSRDDIWRCPRSCASQRTKKHVHPSMKTFSSAGWSQPSSKYNAGKRKETKSLKNPMHLSKFANLQRSHQSPPWTQLPPSNQVGVAQPLWLMNSSMCRVDLLPTELRYYDEFWTDTLSPRFLLSLEHDFYLIKSLLNGWISSLDDRNLTHWHYVITVPTWLELMMCNKWLVPELWSESLSHELIHPPSFFLLSDPFQTIPDLCLSSLSSSFGAFLPHESLQHDHYEHDVRFIQLRHALISFFPNHAQKLKIDVRWSQNQK